MKGGSDQSVLVVTVIAGVITDNAVLVIIGHGPGAIRMTRVRVGLVHLALHVHIVIIHVSHLIDRTQRGDIALTQCST